MGDERKWDIGDIVTRIERLELQVEDLDRAVETTLGNIDIVTQTLTALGTRASALEVQVEGHRHLTNSGGVSDKPVFPGPFGDCGKSPGCYKDVCWELEQPCECECHGEIKP